MVRDRYPDLDPSSGPGAARRWNRLVRLAEIVQEHHAAVTSGAKSPTGVVAEARNVAPATVRSWLHQAKQEGFAVRANILFAIESFAEIAATDPNGESDEPG